MKNSINNKLQENIYFLWNDDKYAVALKGKLGEERIIISESELSYLIRSGNDIDGLVILAELNWNGKRYSEFYGFERAFNLIKEGNTFPLIFCSFLNRLSLRKKTKYSSLLTRIFSFQQLPLNEKFFNNWFEFPFYSKTKWFYIQRLLREESAVYDDIKHRFHVDERNILAVKKAIEYSLEYERILDSDTIIQLYAIYQTIEKNDTELIRSQMLELKQHLDKINYSSVYLDDGIMENSGKESLMLVEDNIEIINKLDKDFSKYFKVNKFTNGRKALDELYNRSNEYDVIIADLELLDDYNNWQQITGYDILELAEKYPHIVLYGLTSMPKRAVSELQENLSARRAKIKYKDPIEYLPLGYTLEAFAEIIKDEVRELRKHKKGPKYGPWKKGLLSTYYDTKSNQEEWKEIILDIYDRVDNLFLINDNSDNIIPKKLFSEKKKEFDKEDLKKIIAHRLVCIYHQHRDIEFRSEEYKELVDIEYRHFKNYLTTILGFSITGIDNMSDINDSSTFVININDAELLEEEIYWINKRKEIDPDLIPVVEYPKLLEILREIQPLISNASLRISKLKKISDYISFFVKFKEAELEIDKDNILLRKIKSSFLWYSQQEEYQKLLELPSTEIIKDVIQNYC